VRFPAATNRRPLPLLLRNSVVENFMKIRIATTNAATAQLYRDYSGGSHKPKRGKMPFLLPSMPIANF
jgi:hypothetical protein